MLFSISEATEGNSLKIQSEQKNFELEITNLQGEPFLSLVELAEKSGLNFKWNPISERWALIQEDEEILSGLIDSPFILKGERLEYQRLVTQFERDQLFIPLETIVGAAELLKWNILTLPTPSQTPKPENTALPTPTIPWGEISAVPTLPLDWVTTEYLDEVELLDSAIFEKQSSGKTLLIIDPGHGGLDSGVKGVEGLEEANYVYEVAILLKRKIEKNIDVDVTLTREETIDRKLNEQERAIRANSMGGDLFISLHLSGSFDSNSQGCSVFYIDEKADQRAPLSFTAKGDPQGKWALAASHGWETAYQPHIRKSAMLATILHQHLTTDAGLPDRGLRAARLTLLRSLQMPSVRVELGVANNRADAIRLQTVHQETLIIDALYQGIVDFLEDTME